MILEPRIYEIFCTVYFSDIGQILKP